MPRFIVTALLGLTFAITLLVDCCLAQDSLAQNNTTKNTPVKFTHKSLTKPTKNPTKKKNLNSIPTIKPVKLNTNQRSTNINAPLGSASSQFNSQNQKPTTSAPNSNTTSGTISPSGEGVIQDPLQPSGSLNSPANRFNYPNSQNQSQIRRKQRSKKPGAKRIPMLESLPSAQLLEDENPEDTSGSYYDGTTEDVLNPFDLNSVKRHIHRLTAPEETKKAKHHKNSTTNSSHPAPKPKAPPKPASEQPFTPEWNNEHGRRVLSIIILMILVMFIAPPFTRKLVKFMTLKRESNEIIKRIRTTTQLFMKFTIVVVMVLGFLEILKEFQIDIGPMLTGAGIFGVALGFAGQNILKDLLAGLFLIVDEQIRVGDFVKVAGISGTVEEISLRKMILRDFSGNVLYVPNSKVDVVINMTREFSRYVLDIPVPYKADFNNVVKLLADVDKEIRVDEKFQKVITEPLTIYGISHFGENGYIVTIRTTTTPGDQWMAAREYRKRIKEKFEEYNIQIPLPQLTIHRGQQREGEANPISIDSFKD